MTSVEQHDNLRQQREEFIREWQLTEKASERIAGLLLLLAAALTIVFDKPPDQITILAIAVCIAGGFTMIFRSRRASDKRKPLAFIRAEMMSNRAIMATLGAVFAIWQGVNQNRFLFLLVGGLLILLSVWYRWRENRIRHFDSLFPKTTIPSDEGDTDD